MALVKSKNTRPEMLVRRLIHGMGYRYRLHKKDLPGKPDIVFVSRKKVILFMAVFGMGTKTLRASCRGYPNRTWIFGGKRYAAINNVTKS